jgi:hypothetical protein
MVARMADPKTVNVAAVLRALRRERVESDRLANRLRARSLSMTASLAEVHADLNAAACARGQAFAYEDAIAIVRRVAGRARK